MPNITVIVAACGTFFRRTLLATAGLTLAGGIIMLLWDKTWAWLIFSDSSAGVADPVAGAHHHQRHCLQFNGRGDGVTAASQAGRLHAVRTRHVIFGDLTGAGRRLGRSHAFTGHQLRRRISVDLPDRQHPITADVAHHARIPRRRIDALVVEAVAVRRMAVDGGPAFQSLRGCRPLHDDPLDRQQCGPGSCHHWAIPQQPTGSPAVCRRCRPAQLVHPALSQPRLGA